MLILGLHFGHDAAAALIRDGEVVACIEKERHTRRKHAAMLRSAQVKALLDDCGVKPEDIDYCTVTSTQHLELTFFEPEELSVAYGPCDGEMLDAGLFNDSPNATAEFVWGSRMDYTNALADPDNVVRNHLSSEELEAFADAAKIPSVERFLSTRQWRSIKTLEHLAQHDARTTIGRDSTRLGFHWPATVNLFGREVPGAFFAHHYAHACYAYYQSGFQTAAVLSHDGGMSLGIESGLVAYGMDNRLWVLAPHGLAAGYLYDCVATEIGLGLIGGAGKLMGLASYGRPRFFDQQFVGTAYESAPNGPYPAEWMRHCQERAVELGYDVESLQSAEVTTPLKVDIAASTQRVFEETILATAAAVSKSLRAAGLNTPNLCVTGGTALNCPSNSRLAAESHFPSLSVAPGCGDSGLAIGSALALYHNVLDQPVKPGCSPAVHLGLSSSSTLAADTVAKFSDDLVIEPVEDPAALAARDLAADLIVGWFEGRSELGPRALGHRSLLANPTVAENWARMNKVKSREWWRPFAPMVLEEEATAWFADTPVPSPFMLFNARVRSERIPAVTHVDGSSRVQTVAADDALFRQVLERFFELTGVPVLMNTSFNGPREPIVETPDHALEFLRTSSLDVVYLNGLRCTRR